MDRRDILKYGAGGAMWVSMSAPALAKKEKLGRVIVIGAGYGGATAAKYLRMWGHGKIEVIVIEPNADFVSCPVSNLVLGGEKTLSDITLPYDLLKQNHGIKWIKDKVIAIDPDKSEIRLSKGKLSYDKLIVATGIDFMYDRLPALNNLAAQQKIPHAWKAGPQTQNLFDQLRAMPDGGVFALTIPAQPYRCPPGPYERACQVAFYLKNHKPKSKVLILDANPAITSKRPLFERVWADLYPGLIEYFPSSSLKEIDVSTRTVKTDFDTVKSDVLNVIPPQRASDLCVNTGLANVDKRWCEVDFRTYESKVFPNIHIIGDGVDSGLPKSAHIATSQAKVCANALAFMLSDEAPDPSPVFGNTCYSYADNKTAMHVTTVYRYDAAEKIMKAAPGGGTSAHPSAQEYTDAQYWALNIWADVLT
ncbi:NAD(P)/FAD-dependent oxidoreductase [Glaciimonas immobilis]|uniref:NADPH-dependent 2,4-dienoyl-CoA reductase/sulfur reductase-like enzyme n=1 Tax=Glaciimonas immobilis TaxID=728004 RepID=A0A840RSI1_9BURK|nr:NAD(P)/FAD-dependent oxidoreductase [Glaciimonas immobilis]KAF3997837.1 FAD-dependent oxidoreductase [Glaciimonas immobilis]MBB5199530.1 NADPH-dependent 2,4-dienoyl-CoA reductase/sulfur reductase-like enzyme [Glaciimonas immobilis]